MKDLNLKFNSFHFSECEVSQCPVEWSGSSYLYWVRRGIVLVQDLTDWLTSQRSNQLVVSAAAHPPIPTLPARIACMQPARLGSNGNWIKLVSTKM